MIISVNQASARFSLSVEHLRQLARLRRIYAISFEGAWMIDEADLLRYLATERKRGRPRKTKSSDAA